MSAGSLRLIGPLRPSEIPPEPLEFLCGLGGPVAIRVEGRDRNRTRVLVTLLHGNEPSGFLGVHGWLREAPDPLTDVLIILGGVRAALLEPPLHSRLLPDGTDLNRCFTAVAGREQDPDARAIVELIEETRPEALIDIHNNSGHNPAYGVVTRHGRAERCLISLFARRFVHYDLRLGALVEATGAICPSVVVEVGRAGDTAADELARRGIERYFSEDVVVDCEQPEALEGFAGPVRVELVPAATVAFGPAGRPDVDLTVDEEIDRHNFELVASGTTIGWIGRESGWPLLAVGADGHERSRELFGLDGDRVIARRALVPIMMTTDAGIARSDCLFYVVESYAGAPA